MEHSGGERSKSTNRNLRPSLTGILTNPLHEDGQASSSLEAEAEVSLTGDDLTGIKLSESSNNKNDEAAAGRRSSTTAGSASVIQLAGESGDSMDGDNDLDVGIPDKWCGLNKR